MIKKLCLLIVFIVVSKFLFCQSLDSTIIDTTITQFELSFKDSIILLNKQNEIYSSSRKAYNYGLDLYNNKRFDDATVFFTNAINIDSSFSEAFFYRGMCNEGHNDTLAIKDYYVAFSLDSTNFSSIYRVASIQSKTDFNKAIKTYDFIISIKNDEPKAYYEIGVLSFLKDDIDKAIKSFTHSIQLNKDPRTYNDRASCYRYLDKDKQAIDDYLVAIDLNPDLAFIYNNLASTYRKVGDTANALYYYNLAIDKDKNYLLAYNNRGSLYLDLNDFQKAVNDIDVALSLDDNYAPAYNNKGVLFHKRKQYFEALSNFDKAISLKNDYGKAYLNRGVTRQMIRDEDGACNDWQKAKDLGMDVAKQYLKSDCN